MTSLRPNTPIVRFRDPRIAIENTPAIAIDQGAGKIDIRRATSNNFSPSQISFNELSTGGTDMILDRKMFVEYQYFPSLRPSGVAGQVVYGTDSGFDLTARATGIQFGTNDLAQRDVGNNGAVAFRPAIPAADRIQQSLNGMLTLVGIDGPVRLVGPRSLGLMNSCTNLNVMVNGNSISTKPDQYLSALEWYGNHGPLEHTDYSKCASYPDLFKTYREGTLKRTSPLASYGGQLTKEPRGSFWNILQDSVTSAVTVASLLGTQAGRYYTIDGFAFRVSVANANNVITIDEVRFLKDTLERSNIESTDIDKLELPILLVEPILIPLFNHGDPQGRGLYGVNQFSIDITMANIDKKWFSGDVVDVPGKFSGDAVHQVAVGIRVSDTNQTSAALHYNILTPKALPELPLVNAYRCRRIDTRASKISVGERTAYSGNINFNTIPERIYIWVAQTSDRRNIQDTDSFCRIDKLNFQFNSSGYQYSVATTEQLFHMSRESGLKMSLPQWRDHLGSVCCVDFSKMVNLGETEYPGLIGSFQITFDASFTVLQDKSTNDLSLYVAIVEDGVAILKDQSMEWQVGNLQVDPRSVPIRYKTFEEKLANMYGGISFDDVKRYGRKAVEYAQKGIEFGQKYAPHAISAIETGMKYAPAVASKLAMLAPLLAAAGMSDEEAYGLMVKHGEDKGMKKIAKRLQGSGLVGGAQKKSKSKSMVKYQGGKQTSRAEMMKYLQM